MKPTDCYQVYVAGMNAHDFAAKLASPGSPFYNKASYPSVIKDVIIDEKFVGGIVEVWVHEHLTMSQQIYLRDDPYILAVHHAFPR